MSKQIKKKPCRFGFRLILCLILFISCTELKAQNVMRFMYDRDGNRTERVIVINSIAESETLLGTEKIGGNSVCIISSGVELRFVIQQEMKNENSGMIVLQQNDRNLLECKLKNEPAILNLKELENGFYTLSITVDNQTNLLTLHKQS